MSGSEFELLNNMKPSSFPISSDIMNLCHNIGHYFTQSHHVQLLRDNILQLCHEVSVG